MQHKIIVVLLIVVLTISISQRESFAPVISPDNATSVSNQTVQQSGSTISQNYIWYIVIIVSISVIFILIYFSMKRYTKSY